MKKLEEKKIIITGGSMGIGYAVAEELAKEGAELILISRHEGDLMKVVKELKNKYGGKYSYYPLDVSVAHEVKKLAQSIAKNGAIDGLVNCAGIYGPIGKIDEINPKEFVDAININLFGTFYMCHYFIPLLKKSERGKIVNFAGGGAATPFPRYSAYSVSKVGIVRFTENIALEFLDDNIDINALAPGFVVTRLHQKTIKAGEKAGKDFFKKTREEIEKGGIPPEKAAALTAFLLSHESDGITGKFISAPWDSWNDEKFLNKLKHNKDFATLRRIDDKTFFKA